MGLPLRIRRYINIGWGINRQAWISVWANVTSAFSHFTVCPLFFVCWKHESFRVKGTTGSKRKSPELAGGGLLKDVVATSTVPVHLTLFSGSLSIWPNILRFNAELSWECSAKSVSISRPQSSSVWVGHLMIVQEVYFRARPGDGGSRWTELWTAHWHTELSEHQLRAVLPYYDQGSQEYADHLRNTITEMLSITMGVRLIKLLMPFRIWNKGHHHHGASRHPSAVESVFPLLYIHLFTSSVFRSRAKVSNDPVHNQWWAEFRCQRWLAPH